MDSEINTQQILESKQIQLIDAVMPSFIEILQVISKRNFVASTIKRLVQDPSELTCYMHAMNRCSSQCDKTCNVSESNYNIKCAIPCHSTCGEEYMKKILGEIYDLCKPNLSHYTSKLSHYKSNPIYNKIDLVTRENFIRKFSRSQNKDTCNYYSTILDSNNIKLVEEIRNLQTTSNTSSSGGKTSRKKSTKKRKQKKSKKSRSKKI